MLWSAKASTSFFFPADLTTVCDGGRKAIALGFGSYDVEGDVSEREGPATITLIKKPKYSFTVA